MRSDDVGWLHLTWDWIGLTEREKSEQLVRTWSITNISLEGELWLSPRPHCARVSVRVHVLSFGNHLLCFSCRCAQKRAVCNLWAPAHIKRNQPALRPQDPPTPPPPPTHSPFCLGVITEPSNSHIYNLWAGPISKRETFRGRRVVGSNFAVFDS